MRIYFITAVRRRSLRNPPPPKEPEPRWTWVGSKKRGRQGDLSSSRARRLFSLIHHLLRFCSDSSYTWGCEPTGRDRAPPVRCTAFATEAAAVPTWSAGCTFSLALLARARASGTAVVVGSQFFSRLFRSAVRRLRTLAGARSPVPRRGPPGMDGAGVGCFWVGRADHRSTGRGTFPGPFFSPVPRCRNHRSVSRLELHAGRALSLGVSVSDDPYTRPYIQPGDFSTAAPGFSPGGGSAGAAGRSHLARGQRH